VTRWAAGILALVVLPLGAVPLLGYAVECTRSARAEVPPPWRLTGRLLRDGLAVLGAIAVIAAPFVLAGLGLSTALHSPALWHSTSPILDVEAATSAALVVALPWGVVMLLLMPHAVARFAASGSLRDLFAYAASLRGVRRDFAIWNVVIAAIVTAWAIGLACSALFCVGTIPGIFYAILVSAHATASLQPESADPSAR
jgi:Protein of unknown function (DUF4013)